MKPPTPAREVVAGATATLAYSICSLVTDLEEYQGMLDSFIRAGFGPGDCEFLYIDNSAGNRADAYAGYNEFLSAARGRRIILCHQDILLNYHHRDDLERRMAELDVRDPAWALLGNAGGAAVGAVAARISHPDAELHSPLPMPFSALSLDENFILVKREANLVLSRDLRGFHLYGTDLCAIARILGWTAWVVDFHLYHKSTGNLDSTFFEMQEQLARKYRRALKGHFVQTTCTEIILGGSRFQRWLWGLQQRFLSCERILQARRESWRKSPPKPAAPPVLPAVGKGWYAAYRVARPLFRPFQNLNRSLRKRLARRHLALRR